MSESEPSPPRVEQALVSALATATLLLLLLGLSLPVATFHRAVGVDSTERVATLWQEGIDHGFTDGGGARAVTYGLMMLVVVLAALVAMWSTALMYGGGIGRTGTIVARVAALVLLVGAGLMVFNLSGVHDLALTWSDPENEVLEPGDGVTWLLAGAVTFAAATLPGSVRGLWSDADQ